MIGLNYIQNMDQDNKKKTISIKLRQPMYLLVVLILLQVILLATTIFVLKGGSNQTNADSNTSFVPIWIAVFIPLIATIRKPQTEKRKKLWMWLLVGLATLVLLGMLVILVKSLN